MNGTDLGTCCNCGGRVNVRNIFSLPRRTPEPGNGSWGCVVCGLPNAGAIAVLCDDCADAVIKNNGTVKILQAVVGDPKECRRIPVDNLPPEPFEHDMTQHVAYMEAMYGRG